MNYKDFTLGDWIGHISGVIEDETTLDGNEMRDLVEFLTNLNQESILDKIREEIEQNAYPIVHGFNNHELGMTLYGILQVIDKYKAEVKE